MRRSLYAHEENRLVFVAGHNIVIHSLDDGSQQFIAGSEHATEINYITLSASGHYVACCERTDHRAQVSIYSVMSRKKKRTLPEPGMENFNLVCKEFLSCDFSKTTEEQHLVTLSGEGDWCAILWQWPEQLKMLAKVDLNIVEPEDPS